MTALPYLATVIVLVLISRARAARGSTAPASLGHGVRAGPLNDVREARGRARALAETMCHPSVNPEIDHEKDSYHRGRGRRAHCRRRGAAGAPPPTS